MQTKPTLEARLLRGCTPEPLSNYLKALGILRLMVEQKDPQAKGYWSDEGFVLLTSLSEAELSTFFLYEYQPTPLVAPWNGSTGFYAKDNQKTLEAMRSSQATRLALYRQTVQIAQQQVNLLGLTTQPKDDQKRQLLLRLRNTLPDEAVKWLDTCALIAAEGVKFPPLTGTGGNDGNFEFSRTFMQQLQELLDFKTGKPQANAALLLQAAVWGETVPGLTFFGKIGQFNPIAAGGANAAPGYDANSRVNPWDFVLMLEGILLFTAGATRRYESTLPGELAYPFTVQATNVGYGSASEQDETRAELWTPLWPNPVGLKELQSLFYEGRAKVGGRTARDGVDFARAVSSLGVDRGLKAFVRYSFQVRNGLSYFAIPLGQFQPHPNAQVDRLTELDRWLNRFKQAVDDKAPAAVRRAQRQLEASIIALSQGQGKLLEVLIALGEVEAVLNRSLRFTLEKRLQPLPPLNQGWIKDCDDLSSEFRLALALAGQNLRQRLVRVRQAPYPVWAEDDDGITIWQQGTLVDNLIRWLQRAEIENQQQTKQKETEEKASAQSQASLERPVASLEDIRNWIVGVTNDERLEAIARGLSLVKSPRHSTVFQADQLPLGLPAAYALLAIAHHRSTLDQVFVTDPQQRTPERALGIAESQPTPAKSSRLPRIPGLLAKLASGDSLTATTLAVQRLRASGLRPALAEGIYEPSDRTRRIAAALTFPIAIRDMAQLLKFMQKPKEKEEDNE